MLESEVYIDIFDDRMKIQFNRLRLMQRQGSRLSKIVEGYKLEENYTQDKK